MKNEALETYKSSFEQVSAWLQNWQVIDAISQGSPAEVDSGTAALMSTSTASRKILSGFVLPIGPSYGQVFDKVEDFQRQIEHPSEAPAYTNILKTMENNGHEHFKKKL